MKHKIKLLNISFSDYGSLFSNFHSFLYSLLPFAFILFSFAFATTFAQETKKNKIINDSQSSLKSPKGIDDIAAPSYRVNIKEGGIPFLVIEKMGGGSLFRLTPLSFTIGGNSLYSYGTDLYWGTNKLALSSDTDNDWTISGNDIYNSNTGKVIIGTTSITSANLNVGGNASTAIYGEGTVDRGSIGGKFTTAGSEGYGVFGVATSTSETGPNYGGYFSSAGTYGHGIYGESTGSFGFGVYAVSTGTSGIGIYASSTNLAGKFNGDVEINGDFVVSGGETTLEQEGWIAPSLLNSWVDYGAGFNPSGYFKDSNGIVHLRGMVKSGSTGTVIFNLPAEYRPPYHEVHSTTTFGSSSGRCDILPNGDVKMVAGSSSYFSLDGITFRAN